MHRLMVTSSAYRMQSRISHPKSNKNPNEQKDPENEYLWRMNVRRMEAEVVRDSILSVAGELETTMGGPEIDESEAEVSKQRSVYFRSTPESQVPFLKLFEGPDPIECYARTESTVPQHPALWPDLPNRPSPGGTRGTLRAGIPRKCARFATLKLGLSR